MKRKEIEPLIVQEWLKRPEAQRGESDILSFHGYLAQSRPDLLSFSASGDKYQVLKTILRNHIKR